MLVLLVRLFHGHKRHDHVHMQEVPDAATYTMASGPAHAGESAGNTYTVQDATTHDQLHHQSGRAVEENAVARPGALLGACQVPDMYLMWTLLRMRYD